MRSPHGPAAGDSPPIVLDESQVRRLIRLLSDALAPDDGRKPKIERLMAGLCDWLHADGWFWVRTRLDPVTGMPENFDFIYGGGLNEQHLALWSERSLEVNGTPPETAALKSRLIHEPGLHVTASRGELVPDSVWAEHQHRDFVGKFGHDATIFSVKPLGLVNGGPMYSFVVIFRRSGSAQFDPIEARLAHAVLTECGPLHADGLNVTIADDVAGLTPRQRNVLALLIDGRSVKEIAKHLDLSIHTVNDHCKVIHRVFGVSSRPELLARFMHK